MNENTRKTVWLIRAQDGEGRTQVGSGVVVWLREEESEKSKKYLLTSAHLVKSFEATEKGYIGKNKTLDRAVCWPHGGGFVEWEDISSLPPANKKGIWLGHLLDPYDRPAGRWSEEDCSAEKDWVLFDIAEGDFQQRDAAPFSHRIVEPLSIVGFPKGIGDLVGGANIRNRVSEGFKLDRDDHNEQILRPEGGWPVGPGMSGGGVFNAKQELVAIYRGQDHGHLSTCSIKIQAIRNELRVPVAATRNLPSCDLVSPATQTHESASRESKSPAQVPEPPHDGDPQVKLTSWQMLALFSFCAILALVSYKFAPLISNVAAALMMAIGTFGFLRSFANYESKYGKFGAAAAVAMSTFIIALLINPSVPNSVDLKGVVYMKVGDEPRSRVRNGKVTLIGSLGADKVAKEIDRNGYFEFLSLHTLPSEQKLEFIIGGTSLEASLNEAKRTPLGDYEFTLKSEEVDYESLDVFLNEVVKELTESDSVKVYNKRVKGREIAIDDIRVTNQSDQYGYVVHRTTVKTTQRDWRFKLIFTAKDFQKEKHFNFAAGAELKVTGKFFNVEQSSGEFVIKFSNCSIL